MKIKIIALLVAMIAVVAMLASCFGKGDGEGNGDGNGDGSNGKYPWNKTDILVQLYESSNGSELTSGLKRYCAGQDSSKTDEIDTLVRNRNTAALADTNVNVKYDYKTEYGWGASVDYIQNVAKTGGSAAPDIFSNFAYDMTACALRGCFANLYSNTSKTTTTYGTGANYFTFTKDGYVGTSDNYFDSEAGQGYFYDYMQSLAFVNSKGEYDKMYCLASNYCVDAVRSFLVVPVNVKLLEEIKLEASTGDVDGNGVFDIEDFYKVVWEYGWTYDVLAQLSAGVYQNTSALSGEEDIKDRLGFCAGKSSGLTASGIVYTTSVKIIEKYQGEDGWSYRYPETNKGLEDLADALKVLFTNSDGVLTLSSADATAAGYSNGELDAIRTRFSEDGILFGGVIAVGSLEEAVYQKMNDTAAGNKGFGVVPVPLYQQDENKTEKYQTLVHNIARIFAICGATTEFEQCSAFLDYQSTHSANILEMYYTENLVAAVEGGEAGKHNVEMLKYIRNHVRDCFDKTHEDVMSQYKSETDDAASAKRWHGIFYTNGYVVNNMADRYKSEYAAKQTDLTTVLAEWAKLK